MARKLLRSEIWADGLRDLYAGFGYTPYRMEKFEPYDFYVRNKDFLSSEAILTFTDVNGQLMALKPDITLSIVRASRPDRPGTVQRFSYDESVYRAGPARSFRELRQIGIECIGDLDDLSVLEVLLLAVQSLWVISPDSQLDVSHIGVIEALLDAAGLNDDGRIEAYRCLSAKNAHELASVCRRCGCDQYSGMLQTMLALSGPVRQTLPELERLLSAVPRSPELQGATRILRALADSDAGDHIRIDFSVSADPRYYQGFAFKGFIRNVPERVLSGGEYGRLMQRMGRASGAAGFAVYLDALAPLDYEQDASRADLLVLYNPTDDPFRVFRTVRRLAASGYSVSAQRSVPEHRSFGKIIALNEAEAMADA